MVWLLWQGANLVWTSTHKASPRTKGYVSVSLWLECEHCVFLHFSIVQLTRSKKQDVVGPKQPSPAVGSLAGHPGSRTNISGSSRCCLRVGLYGEVSQNSSLQKVRSNHFWLWLWQAVQEKVLQGNFQCSMNTVHLVVILKYYCFLFHLDQNLVFNLVLKDKYYHRYQLPSMDSFTDIFIPNLKPPINDTIFVLLIGWLASFL